MIAIIDYGVGNLFSLKSSFGAIGAEAVVTADPAEIHAQSAHAISPFRRTEPSLQMRL